ncbi:MAG TPA: hypothetical protein VMW52_01115 [Phycisphaerae bacterium]|nr:hypothetical protein [Phycisphaerae bacterium]
MGMSTKHGLYGVKLGAALLGGITGQNVALENEITGEATSGEVYRRFLALYSQRVAPGFTTRAIAAALAACGPLGTDLATSNLEFYAQKHADGSTRASGAVHRKFLFDGGILVPRMLNVAHRGDAELTYDAVIKAIGANDPVTITDNSTLPAGLVDTERYTLGPVKIGNVTLNQKMNLAIDFGIEAVGESADSDIWDTLVSIVASITRITLTGNDVAWLKSTNIPLTGKAATHANTIIYLRKRAHAATFVADETEEHIKLTADGMAIVDNPLDASGNAAATTSLVLETRYDGTNAPLTVDTASAIT